MMCLSCNCELTDIESVRKDIRGEYVDLCNKCLFPIRKDLTLSNNFDLNIIQSTVISSNENNYGTD